jgi:hypothetical protein
VKKHYILFRVLILLLLAFLLVTAAIAMIVLIVFEGMMKVKSLKRGYNVK